MQFNPQLIYLISITIFGCLMGLAVNYLTDNLPAGRFLKPPACPCGLALSWKDYGFFRPCPSCQKNRSMRAILVQVVIPALVIIMWLFPPHRLGFWMGSLLLFYFSVVAVIDIEHRVVQHPVSIFGAAIGLSVGIVLHGWWMTLTGGVAGFGFMLVLFFFGEGFRRLMAKIRKEEVNEVALGFGDVNLNGVIGLIMGWPGIVGGMFLSVMLAGVFSLLLIGINVIRRSYQPNQAIPYAPFLILGSMYLLFII